MKHPGGEQLTPKKPTTSDVEQEAETYADAVQHLAEITDEDLGYEDVRRAFYHGAHYVLRVMGPEGQE